MKACLLFILFLSLKVVGQTPEENLEKYNYYRERLKNDFMLMGDCQGCSIIADARGWGGSGDILKFGDAVITLGWHIGVLATEYRLLKNEGKNTDKTTEELYYALMAFNRLDLTAESYYRCENPMPLCNPSAEDGDLNGFFIRDDVDTGFVRKNKFHFNQNLTSNRLVNGVFSDFTETDKKLNEESHDQIWHLMMGIALVKFCLDDDVYFNNYNLKDETIEINRRVIRFLQKGEWTIKNPITKKHVLRGAYAQLLANGAVDAANFIDPNHTYFGIISDNYLSLLLWELYQDMPKCPFYVFGHNACKEYSKIMMLAAIGNSWHSCALSPINTTNFSLSRFCKKEGLEHLPLLRQVLHGGNNNIPNSKYEELLNSAPEKGPYNFGYPSNSTTYEWSSTHRFNQPVRRGYNWDNGIEFIPGEYNGLDYMLLFNLYRLANKNYLDKDILITSFPNPSTGQTTIKYTIRQDLKVSISLYNFFGQKILNFINESKIAGSYDFNVDLSFLPDGIYLCTATTENDLTSQRIVLIKN